MFTKKTYTLNFDGSHNNQDNKAGAGCIIRDNQGDLVVAATYNLSKTGLPCYNVAIAEAMGLKNGLVLARQNSLTLNFVKGDNEEVIDLVLGHAQSRPGSALSAIIDDIKSMLNVRLVVVKCINRADNRVADKLASMGSSLLNESKVFLKYAFDLPLQVAELIKQEKVGNHSNEGNDGEGINIVKVGGAIAAGVALLGIGYSMFSSGESSSNSSNQQMIKSKVTEAQKAWSLLSNTFTGANNAPASLESPGFFTLQYFGSDRNQLQKARAGCIILNNGEFVVASAHNLDHEYPDCNIAIAEAIALKKGLKLAQDNNVRLSLIQGRNVEIRDRVLGHAKKQPRFCDLSSIINDIKLALENQQMDPDYDTLELVGEDAIGAARALATEGGKLQRKIEIYNRVEDLPDKVRDHVG